MTLKKWRRFKYLKRLDVDGVYMYQLKCDVCTSKFLSKSMRTRLCSDECLFKTEPFSPKKRFVVFLRDNFKCTYCGAKPTKTNNVKLHVDHLNPKILGGVDTLENLVTACQTCNIGKGTLRVTK
jgi:5-methylcytosine-specific restriction endonuclease McrA